MADLDESICPYCGAYTTRSCESEDDTFCPWAEDVENENSNLNAAIDDRVERSRARRNGGHDHD